jgi:hypothetical protein
MSGPRTPPTLDELVQRLRSAEASVRRIAVADLANRASGSPRATEALATHLGVEADEKSRIAIIRHLGHSRHAPSRAELWALYANTDTPARVAHAAILAHDMIELSEQSRSPTMPAWRAERA